MKVADKIMRPKSSGDRVEDKLISESLRASKVTKDPLEKLRLLCLSRGTTGVLTFGRFFRRMDDNESGTLDNAEFSKGIQECGLNLSEEETQDLFDQFDRDKSGSIDIDELMVALRPPMSEYRKKSIGEAFTKLDKSGDGIITIEDLKGTYSVRNHPKYLSGELTEDAILKKFLANFEDKEADGKVTRDEFIDYYSGISASIDSDVYFDLMLRRAYNL